MPEQGAYFAYGSNLDSAQMLKRIGSARNPQRARLVGYRLAFNKRAQSGNVVANIIPTSGHETWGVVYRCTSEELAKLDKCEVGYTRERLAVALENDTSARAFVYIASPVNTCDEGNPSDSYLAVILRGARKHGLPGSYIEDSEHLATQHGGT